MSRSCSPILVARRRAEEHVFAAWLTRECVSNNTLTRSGACASFSFAPSKTLLPSQLDMEPVVTPSFSVPSLAIRLAQAVEQLVDDPPARGRARVFLPEVPPPRFCRLPARTCPPRDSGRGVPLAHWPMRKLRPAQTVARPSHSAEWPHLVETVKSDRMTLCRNGCTRVTRVR